LQPIATPFNLLAPYDRAWQWQTKPQARAAVLSTIRFTLNDLPKEPYPQNIWDQKVQAAWAYVFGRGQMQQTWTEAY
jgi:hypothetical protein